MQGAMVRVVSALVKILIASLLTGILLTRLNLSAEQILLELGMTPERILVWLERGAIWLVPNVVLGLIVVVPVWLVIHLFRPPRR
jgi:Na+/H+-dicarboxylate symporter